MKEDAEQLSLELTEAEPGVFKFRFAAGGRVVMSSELYSDVPAMRADMIRFIKAIVADQFMVYDNTSNQAFTTDDSAKRVREQPSGNIRSVTRQPSAGKVHRPVRQG